MADESDPFLSWAKRRIAEWDKSLPMLDARRITMSETRDGKPVDVTAEHAEQVRIWRGELVDAMERHRARMLKVGR